MTDYSRFEYDSVQDTESIIQFLQSLKSGFENGRIVLRSDQEELVLHPEKLLNFAIKARKKGDLCKLSLKLSWKEVNLAESADSLVIGT